MRLLYIVPFPFDAEGVEKRRAQVPRDALRPDTVVDCVPVLESFAVDVPRPGESYYETALLDLYCAEAGLRAEEDGYDAVIMDTVSDSGLLTLRSRLSIPVIGPGIVSYAMGIMLGKRFSIVTYTDGQRFLYEKTLHGYDLQHKCASVRAAGVVPNFEALFDPAGAEEEFAQLTAAAQAAIDEDGADVILLGSTTMHQAGDYMSRHLPVPVVNPGTVAIKLAETIVELGLSHSKVGYPSPSVVQDDKFAPVERAG